MNKQITISRHSRRQFIRYGSMAVSGAMMTGPYLLRGQNLNSKLNVAQIGCSGKGGSDASCIFHWQQNIVALCDVSQESLDGLKHYLPGANTYRDYRELFDKEKGIDAVDIGIPDHMHAVVAATAIKLGKHVYCQKPLTHDVFEARTLRELARKYNVATQMGNQGSASDTLRRAVEIVQAGVIGHVKTAYVWTNRPIWPQGLERPTNVDPVPAELDWNLWLGTAPDRPFAEFWPKNEQTSFGKNVYQPRSWRGWHDFGTGALGDMACHTCNWPFRALKLGYPTEIESTTPSTSLEMYPKSSRIRFEFPEREGLPAATLHWSDGGAKPAPEVTADIEATMGRVSDSGCLMIGEKGIIFSPDDGDQELRTFIKMKGDTDMVGSDKHDAVKAIPQTIPRNAFEGSSDQRQHMEWIQACKDGKHDVAYSNFEIAAYLTEIILLGCVALRAGQKLEWDGPAMRAKNLPDADRFVKRVYRQGYSL
jgi:hypothetical protein